MCIFVHVGYTRAHPSLCRTNQRNSWPWPSLIPPPPSSAEPCLLCISHRSGGRGVRITVGLHIRLQLPVLSPPTSPHPTQDVLGVTVSTSPSGHIPDIWTAAGSPRVRRLEEKRGGGGNEGAKETKEWSQKKRIHRQREKKQKMERIGKAS